MRVQRASPASGPDPDGGAGIAEIDAFDTDAGQRRGRRRTVRPPDRRGRQRRRALFARTVREGVTDLVRHSPATQCRISLSTCERRATLTVVNDGINPALAAHPRRAALEDGRGVLDALRSRLQTVGGDLSAVFDADGTIRLEAAASLRRAVNDV